MNFFCQTVNDWLRVTEVRIQDLDVTPDDSVSQLGLRNRKRSGCGSAYSRSSRASSISVARAKEAARSAELQAEVHALKQRQLIHDSELRLKKEELDLQFKKNQLKLETEFKKAVARESAYAKADSERNTRVASYSLTSRVPRVDPRPAAISDGFSLDLKQESSRSSTVPISDLKNARLNTRFQVSPVQTLMDSLALVTKPFTSSNSRIVSWRSL